MVALPAIAETVSGPGIVRVSRGIDRGRTRNGPAPTRVPGLAGPIEVRGGPSVFAAGSMRVALRGVEWGLARWTMADRVVVAVLITPHRRYPATGSPKLRRIIRHYPRPAEARVSDNASNRDSGVGVSK